MIYEKKNFFIVSYKNLGLLIFLFLTTILTIRSFKEINIHDLVLEGDKLISKKDIIENSSLTLPTKLIYIKTRLLEKELKRNLALKNIIINRRLIPFGLKINLQTRIPLAYAESKKLDKIIYGYVDVEGIFIPKEFASIKGNEILPIKIIGWEKNFEGTISKIFKLYENNINDLELISFESDEFIFLEEKILKKILLGYDILRIDSQLNLIPEIKKQLQQKNILKKLESLDITDPNNPKIKVFKP